MYNCFVLLSTSSQRGVLKGVCNDLDKQVGRNRIAKESDMKNLPYIEEIIKVTRRLYPAAPLELPHKSMEACEIGGY